ncbi:hypothetical protein [Fretibacter rubidus]|uniref:hypothetical protein n=1 Tax=Fretibacter rubidus TaxID=570162 RepID=UPI00352BB035
MRIAVLALSTVLLSGCSWLGNMTGGAFGPNAQNAGHYGAKKMNRCQVPHAQAPLPRGCHPSQVTIGMAQGGNNQFAGGFSQTPQFGNPQQFGAQDVTGAYGSHAHNAGAINPGANKRKRKPKLRGSLSLGLEKSNAGDYLDFVKAGTLDPSNGYDPSLTGPFVEQRTEGSPTEGEVTTRLYSAEIEEILRPTVSFDDVHSTPLSLRGGLEYIVNPKTTVFANAGYTYAEGNSGPVARVIGTLHEDTITQFYDEETLALLATGTSRGFIPNNEVATFDYNFSDMERIDLEVGARRYFNPIMKNSMSRTVTPFVGASIGASHHNSQSFDVTQRQVFFERAYLAGGTEFVEDRAFYSVPDASPQVELYDSQWVPSGQLNAGLEWQATPKTAIAFETGLRFEGARDYANGTKGDDNIAIPVTIRGSYNF